MLLYKYLPANRALEVLLTQKIYFAHRREFNDPLDGKFMCPPPKKGKKESRAEAIDNIFKHVKYNQRLLDESNLGFFSMSENCESYPMWAHYANEHKGCCLKFNFPNKKRFPFLFTEKVEYSDKLPGLGVTQKRIPHETGSMYMTKSKQWEYEVEWRAVMYDGAYNPYTDNKPIFTPPKGPNFKYMQGSGVYELSENLLQGIILGCKMKNSERESVIVAANNRKIKIHQISPSDHGVDMRLRDY